MSGDEQSIEGEWSCPHCGATWNPVELDWAYHDDYADDTYTTCEDCGKPYQLRCVAVTIEFETRTYVESEG